MKEQSHDHSILCIMPTKGFWNAGDHYYADDIVYLDAADTFWRCLKANTNSWPAEGSCWTRVVGGRAFMLPEGRIMA
jgi:hypothetical protein